MSKQRIQWKNHLVELLVVIFGITIAFTIDKMAEQRKESKEMSIAMESIMDDLSRDINVFENNQIPNNQQQMDRLQRLIELLQAEDLENDSVPFLITRTLGSMNSRITNATFESLKSSGKLEDIPNTKIRRRVVSYYQSNWNQSDYLSNVNVAYSKQLSDYMATISSSFFTGDFSERRLLTDPTFRSMLARWRNMISFKIREYNRLVKESRDLLEFMEKELE